MCVRFLWARKRTKGRERANQRSTAYGRGTNVQCVGRSRASAGRAVHLLTPSLLFPSSPLSSASCRPECPQPTLLARFLSLGHRFFRPKLLRPAGFVSLIVVLAPPRSSLIVDFFSDRDEIAVFTWVMWIVVAGERERAFTIPSH
jgi:hypothetical protein